MKEIKVRAWDGKSIRYDVTGLEHGTANEMAIIFLDGYPYTLNVRDIAHPHAIAMQYTGLKDRNGVEIYEGDIVKVHHENYDDHKSIGKVWWYDCYYPAFDLYIPSKETRTGFEHYSEECNAFSDPDNVYEVIGNIYENPELLEGEE